nr:hypothetical protein [uncultured bacterium]
MVNYVFADVEDDAGFNDNCRGDVGPFGKQSPVANKIGRFSQSDYLVATTNSFGKNFDFSGAQTE